tara:strand:- start:2293 stop:2394 length:102 start_codon:yes stop_codon:yes gene_type:complete
MYANAMIALAMNSPDRTSMMISVLFLGLYNGLL